MFFAVVQFLNRDYFIQGTRTIKFNDLNDLGNQVAEAEDSGFDNVAGPVFGDLIDSDYSESVSKLNNYLYNHR